MPQKSVEPIPWYRPMISSVGLGRELRAQPDARRDREVARHVPDELLDRLVLGLGAPFETGPVRRDRDPALALRGLFDEDAQAGRHRLIVPARPEP